MRGLVFAPPYVNEGEPEPQDVVQLHLEHRLVKRLISRFASQGFRSSIGRITAIVGPGAQPRVVLVGRLSLFGPGARRLHEEIIPIGTVWACDIKYRRCSRRKSCSWCDARLKRGIASRHLR
jgi:hypothetical protein